MTIGVGRGTYANVLTRRRPLTDHWRAITIPAMAFGRKRKEEASQQQSAPQSAPQPGTPWQSYAGSGGYVTTELPYYDKGKRKVMVYKSDASGKIIKTFKK